METAASLPLPATTKGGEAQRGRVAFERTTAPALITLAVGLVAVSSDEPKAELLFIGASTVALGLYFFTPPKVNEGTHPKVLTFLRWVPQVFTTFGCILVVLGIGNAFPDEIALIPLFSFVGFAALAAFFGTMLPAWTTATFYGAALLSLATFVVFAFLA